MVLLQPKAGLFDIVVRTDCIVLDEGHAESTWTVRINSDHAPLLKSERTTAHLPVLDLDSF